MPLSIGDLPKLRHSRCVRYRFRYSHCNRCVDECPAAALTLSEEGVELDATRCNSCGLCVLACPTAVFHQPGFPASALAEPVGKQLAVSCKPSGQPGDLHLPCLGDLDPALLASLGLRNIAVILRGTGHCTECAHAPQGAVRVETLLAAMQELDEEKAPKWIAPVVDESHGGSAHQADRRQLFRRFSNRAMESFRGSTDRGTVPESAIRAAAHFVPARRQLAERILERLDALPVQSLLPVLFDVADIEPRAGACTGCDACARVCPTGALKSSEVETRWSLQFRAGQCVGCGACIEACDANALILERRWKPEAEEPTPLHKLSRFRCEGCGRFFIGLDEERCPVCRDDEESFDAIFG